MSYRDTQVRHMKLSARRPVDCGHPDTVDRSFKISKDELEKAKAQFKGKATVYTQEDVSSYELVRVGVRTKMLLKGGV